MKRLYDFSGLLKWIASTEMFARPSRQLPGRWLLFEYYTEDNDQLINHKEEQLKNKNHFWELNFRSNGSLSQKSNIPVGYFKDISDVKWYVSRNYIIWKEMNEQGNIIEFQFAISKGVLKLLKKYSDGRIEFFGFFKKPDRV